MSAKWPQRVIAMLGREPQVDDWFSECCIEDFHQIDTQAELDHLLDHYDEMDSGGRFWPTEYPARDELMAEEGADWLAGIPS